MNDIIDMRVDRNDIVRVKWYNSVTLYDTTGEVVSINYETDPAEGEPFVSSFVIAYSWLTSTGEVCHGSYVIARHQVREFEIVYRP